MGWSISKPLGGKNSVVRRTVSHPGTALVGGSVLGLTGAALGAGLHDANANVASKNAELERQMAASSRGGNIDFNALAAEEEAKRQALGQQQQGQILDFANQQEGRVADYRKQLASHLADTAQQTFSQANPSILEDLNSRGLFTSQTARDQEQGRFLQQLATQQQQQLGDFDTAQFNNLNDIRSTGLSALLGGNQSALDAALELRKAGIQRQFDVADQNRQMAFSNMLANKQSRDQLIGSILGLGGQLGAGFLGR